MKYPIILAALYLSWVTTSCFASEATFDPDNYEYWYNSQYGDSLRFQVPWTESIVGEVRAVIEGGRKLRTARNTSFAFTITNLSYSPMRTVEYGLLDAEGNKTLFAIARDITLAYISHNLHLQIPANTEFNGLYLKISPE